MKHLFTTVIASLNLLACSNIPGNNKSSLASDTASSSSVVHAPAAKSYLDSCKYLHERIMYYVEQVDLKTISKKEAKKKTDSLQNILYQLRDKITLTERKELSDYANMLLNEMVDRKVIRDRK